MTMAARSSPGALRINRGSPLKRPLLRQCLVLVLALLLVLFAASSLLSSAFRLSFPRSRALPAERSFIKSLQTFLLQEKFRRVSETADSNIATDDSTSTIMNDETMHRDVRSVFDPQIEDLDNVIFSRENADILLPYRMYRPLRVYVYDMPRKFTYDLLQLFQETYKETANLTSNGSPVHRLIEQHSIDYWLWADLLAPESERAVKTVVRVLEQRQADIFYIPFFTTISFFLLEKPQRSLLYRVWTWVQRFLFKADNLGLG